MYEVICLLLYFIDFQIFFPFHSNIQMTITMQQFKTRHMYMWTFDHKELQYHLLQL